MNEVIAIVIVIAILVVFRAIITLLKNGLAMTMMNIINKILGNKK